MKTFFLTALTAVIASAIPVKLTTSLPSPQRVGSVIGLLPRIQPTGPGLYNFRYMVSVNGGPFRVVRDFSQDPTFSWSPELYEHQARIRLTVRVGAEMSDAEIPFAILPRASSGAGCDSDVTSTRCPVQRTALSRRLAIPSDVPFERRRELDANSESALPRFDNQ